MYFDIVYSRHFFFCGCAPASWAMQHDRIVGYELSYTALIQMTERVGDNFMHWSDAKITSDKNH